MGKDKRQCILTLVERKSGFNRIAKLPNRTAKNVIKAMIEIIAREPDIFKTITFDNGTEFHSYKVLDVNAGFVFPLLSGDDFPVSGKKIIRSQRLRLSGAPSFCRNQPVSSMYVNDATSGPA